MKMIQVSTEYIENLPSRFTQRRLEQLGEGFYSQAWAPEKSDTSRKWVWKISKRCDPSYMAFLTMMAEGLLKGTHFPKVKLVLHDGAGRFAALLERLRGLDQFDKEDPASKWGAIKNIYRDMASRIRDVRWALRSKDQDRQDRGYEVLNELPYTLASSAIDLCFGFDKYNENHPRKELGFDMHDGNFMVRNDGTMVITDPFA